MRPDAFQIRTRLNFRITSNAFRCGLEARWVQTHSQSKRDLLSYRFELVAVLTSVLHAKAVSFLYYFKGILVRSKLYAHSKALHEINLIKTRLIACSYDKFMINWWLKFVDSSWTMFVLCRNDNYYYEMITPLSTIIWKIIYCWENVC